MRIDFVTAGGTRSGEGNERERGRGEIEFRKKRNKEGVENSPAASSRWKSLVERRRKRRKGKSGSEKGR